MKENVEAPDESSGLSHNPEGSYDYSHVNSTARVARYDDLLSAPAVTEIPPAPTGEFIENLATTVYQQAQQLGGTIPYTVVREVSENFIHARFAEVTVSILDSGNTIRFADHGPGIAHKDRAQQPGFSSAIAPMKSYIRGVGSGLPIVREYLNFSHGTISIEDNLVKGSVVTISLNPQRGESSPTDAAEAAARVPYGTPLSQPERTAVSSTPAGTALVPPEPYAPQPEAPLYPPQPAVPSFSGGGAPRQSGGGYTVEQPPYQQQPVMAAGFAPQPYPAYSTTPAPQPAAMQGAPAAIVAGLTDRERQFLPLLLKNGALGVTDLRKLTDSPQSSTYATLKKLEEAQLVEKTTNQKRILTNLGYQVASLL